MLDTYNKKILAQVIIKTRRKEIPIGTAELHITGDSILETESITLEKLNLICKKGLIFKVER